MAEVYRDFGSSAVTLATPVAADPWLVQKVHDVQNVTKQLVITRDELRGLLDGLLGGPDKQVDRGSEAEPDASLRDRLEKALDRLIAESLSLHDEVQRLRGII